MSEENTEAPQEINLEDGAEETATDQQVEPTGQTEPEQTFDAEYVKSLRAEAAEYRVKAKRADALAQQAVTAMVTADGRLIDPSDLPYSDDMTKKDGTIDAVALSAAIDALIKAKPHLARKRPTAPISQGVRPSKAEPNLLQIIQSGA
jgi:hypothetical protein